MSISSNSEPRFYHQAIRHHHWRDAMHSELSVWKQIMHGLLPLSHQTKHSIGCKWIYKIKYRSDGSTERYKAHLVAKGYLKQKGWIL